MKQIDANFDHAKQKYQRVWKVINKQWELQLHKSHHVVPYSTNLIVQLLTFSPSKNESFFKTEIFQTLSGNILIRIEICYLAFIVLYFIILITFLLTLRSKWDNMTLQRRYPNVAAN